MIMKKKGEKSVGINYKTHFILIKQHFTLSSNAKTFQKSTLRKEIS